MSIRFSVLLAAMVLCFASNAFSASDGLAGLSMPLIGPEYGAPPRTYHDSQLVTITIKTTPEVLRKLVPKPMVANPDGLINVYFGHFNGHDYRNGDFEFKGETYEETGFVAPVSLGKQVGGYSLFLYLNKVTPAISGREIWGFPKKEADIAMTEADGKITFTVTRQGTTIMKATFTKKNKVEPIPNRPPRARYNLKYIPSARKNAPPDVMQIVSYMQDTKIKELFTGDATLELGSTSTDPLGQIPVLKVIRAEYMVVDGMVDYGDVLYDYLKQGR